MSLEKELTVANHILEHENVLDSFGHISVRISKDKFLMSAAKAPALVQARDLITFGLDGEPTEPCLSPLYSERFIHAAVYDRREEVQSVCHGHSPELLPFGISREASLCSVIHTAQFIGGPVPVWDIADEFGPNTDLLVRDITKGNSLVRTLGNRDIALMRGHGQVVVGRSIREVVKRSIAAERNARVQRQALDLGGVIPLSPGECGVVVSGGGRESRGERDRTWDHLVARAEGVPALGE